MRIIFITKKMPGWYINGVRVSPTSSSYRWGKRNRSWMTHSGLLLAFATVIFASEKDNLHQTQKMLKTMPQSIKSGQVSTSFLFFGQNGKVVPEDRNHNNASPEKVACISLIRLIWRTVFSIMSNFCSWTLWWHFCRRKDT